MGPHAYTRLPFIALAFFVSVQGSVGQAVSHRTHNDRGGTNSGNQYCASAFFNDGSADHFIDGVVLGTISTTNTGFTSDANGWNDRFFDGTGTVTWLETGGSFVLAITTGIAPSSHYYAWLDLDRDNTFADSELLGHFQGTGSDTQGTIAFSVPGNSRTGYTGLRVFCTSEDLPDPDPCGFYANGEAEDYAVLIAPASPCAPVNSEGTTQGDFISALTLGSYSDTPGSAGQYPYKPPGAAVHLDAGTSYDLTLTSGEFATDRYKAWVDWNNDNDWDDAGETVGEFVSTTSFTAQQLALNVPSAIWGWFPLRVRCADTDMLTPCNDVTWGETRDYMIVVNNPLLPCLTYSYDGATLGHGIDNVIVNGSMMTSPEALPNHWIRGSDPVVHVGPGDMVQVQVTGNENIEGGLTCVYADLNGDLDYDDANEYVDCIAMTMANQVNNYSFMVPISVSAGGYFIRVVNYHGGIEFPAACDHPIQGQVMDIYFIVDYANGPCVPGYTNWTSEGDFIDGVRLGTINNVGTGAAYGQVYNKYTALSTDLIVTHAYDLLVTSGAYNMDNYHAWIDYNDDNDFNDANELLGSATNNTAYQDLVIPFTVPAGTTVGSKRMRVRCIWNTGPDPCADGGYGETEDYTVNIDLNTSLAEQDQTGWFATLAADGSHIIVTGNYAASTINLLDAAGRTVRTLAKAQYTLMVPVEDLAHGIYTVERIGTDSRTARRVLVGH